MKYFQRWKVIKKTRIFQEGTCPSHMKSLQLNLLKQRGKYWIAEWIKILKFTKFKLHFLIRESLYWQDDRQKSIAKKRAKTRYWVGLANKCSRRRILLFVDLFPLLAICLNCPNILCSVPNIPDDWCCAGAIRQAIQHRDSYLDS